MKNHLVYFVCIVLIFASSYGCGKKSEDQAEKKNETKTDNAGEIKKEIDPVQENMTKKIENGTGVPQSDANKTNELGMTPGLPKDFPSDVPLPKNSKTLGSLNSSDGTVVTFESNDKVLDIVNFYKEELQKNGYTVTKEGESQVSDKGGLINWTKEKKEVGLMLGFDKDKNITSLVITYR